MGVGLLFLAVLATLVSCENLEGNRVLGGRGAYRIPQNCWHLAGPVFPSTFVMSLCRGLAQGKWELVCRRAWGHKWMCSS